MPGDDVEHRYGVGHTAAHRTSDVVIQIQRHDPVAARQAHGRSDAGEQVVRRRSANRVAGIGAEPDDPEARRYRRPGAAAAAGGNPVERVGVARVTRNHAADGLVRRERPLRHVGLGEHDGAGLANPANLEGIVGRYGLGECRRARTGWHVRGVVVVLDDHRDAVKRSRELSGGEHGVELVGPLQRPRIHPNDGVECWPALVVGVDARQIRFDQLSGSQLARLHRRVDPGDRCLHRWFGPGAPVVASVIRCAPCEGGYGAAQQCGDRDPAVAWARLHLSYLRSV